ncbi:TetR/AcrR family transcriptional regulator [Enterocloster citroniae]|uniref:TetR/AcrR family transcriptional regulator n=1 Tax=Enterocloster citroniae TaxID=358743 RepID=UPI002E78E7DE|nr:TetR/AcrR family transcriptional regulator [Enterocloster citroniae]
MMEKFFALSKEKQDTIRNAALACFSKHGYEKASIHDIAVAAGISKASIFQYFGNKQALYQYLLDYCTGQMKQAYDANTLEENTDFFDRVWEASMMKVQNLKKYPHIASFIASAAAEQVPELKDAIFSATNEKFVETLVLHEDDCRKFKRPEDAKLMFRMFMMLAQGMSVQLENGADYDDIMNEFGKILNMLKYNFYKEEYLR